MATGGRGRWHPRGGGARTQLRLEGRRGGLSGGAAVPGEEEHVWGPGHLEFRTGLGVLHRIPPQPDPSSARLSPIQCSVQGLATIGDATWKVR